MTPLLADVIGLVGSALFIAAFAYANISKSLNKVWFNLANLAGAILLLISLSVTFNLAAFALEAAWGAIAAVGLVLALRARHRPQPINYTDKDAPNYAFRQKSDLSREELRSLIARFEAESPQAARKLRLHDGKLPKGVSPAQYERTTGGVFGWISRQPEFAGQSITEISRIQSDLVHLLAGRI